MTLILFLLFINSNAVSQNSETDFLYGDFVFQKAYSKLNCMLLDSCQINFKEAVFEVENAFFDNELDQNYFNFQVKGLVALTKSVVAADNLIYKGEDRQQMQMNASIFQVICDSFPVLYKDTSYTHLPFRYDFDDIWGHQKWSNMFVSKLLDTRKGNCHSLPYLYKIIAEELKIDAHLAIAPNHFYIKQHSKTNGWYNTELTSGQFPTDAWLMASGYIHLDAVVNKLYMEALSEKQDIAVVMIDLAKGYQKRFGVRDGMYIQKCIAASEKIYPNYINMLILKAEIMQQRFELLMKENNAKHATEIFYLSEAKDLFEDLQLLTGKIHTLGYRKMPEEMYLEWLVTLSEQKEKYSNKKISNFK